MIYHDEYVNSNKKIKKKLIKLYSKNTLIAISRQGSTPNEMNASMFYIKLVYSKQRQKVVLGISLLV